MARGGGGGGEEYNTKLPLTSISCQEGIEQKHTASKFLVSIIRITTSEHARTRTISKVKMYCDNQ